MDESPSKTLQAFITKTGPKGVRWFENIQIITWGVRNEIAVSDLMTLTQRRLQSTLGNERV